MNTTQECIKIRIGGFANSGKIGHLVDHSKLRSFYSQKRTEGLALIRKCQLEAEYLIVQTPIISSSPYSKGVKN